MTDPIPLTYPCATFFLDESGSKGTGGRFVVVGGIKTRKPGHLAREIEAVRDEHRFRGEFKFASMTRRSVPLYRDLIDVIRDSDVHLKAFVIDKRLRDPFADVPLWDAQATLAAQLLVGSINRHELAAVMMDSVSTPVGVAVEEVVRDKVNERLGSLAVVSCVSLDSRTSVGLQLADLVVGAVAYDRKARGQAVATGGLPAAASPKGQVHRMFCAAFGLADLSDVRGGRASILTSRPGRRGNRARLGLSDARV